MESKDKRRKILVAVDWFTPAFRAGGPIRSVANAVSAFASEYNFFIVCGAYDLDVNQQDQELDVETGRWITTNEGQVIYLRREDWTPKYWREILADVQPHTLYLNSMFSGPFSRMPLRVAQKWMHKHQPTLRIVLAPRGMLDTGAMAIKPLKKYTFLSVARAIGRYNNLVWQASGTDEAESITRHFPGAAVLIAENISAAPPTLELPSNTGEHYLTVGRVHAIKNQAFAAAVLARRAEKTGKEIVYHLIGHIEQPAYLLEVQELAGRHGLGRLIIKVSGALPSAEISSHFSTVRALLAPSHNENFGHAIAESLSIGCPVLVSDQTPWNEKKLAGAGRQLSLKLSEWESALDWLENKDIWQQARENALKNFSSAHSNPDILAAHRKLWTS